MMGVVVLILALCLPSEIYALRNVIDRSDETIPSSVGVNQSHSCCQKACSVLAENTSIEVSCVRCQCGCIPRGVIPVNTTRLILEGNTLRILSNHSFVKFTKIQLLILRNNTLHTIESQAFAGLNRLVWLDVSQNPIKTFGDFVFLPITQLTFLSVEQTKTMVFNSNSIYHMSSIKKLDFDRNPQTNLPSFVNKDGRSVVPNIDKIRFKYNNLQELRSENFRGLEMVSELNFGNNQIQAIQQKCFQNLTRLTLLNLARNKLMAIQHSSFWSNSLMDLSLADSEQCTLNVKTQANFEHLPQLRHLSLRKCAIDLTLTSNNLRKLFSTFENLTELDLSLTKLPNYAVEHFRYMRNLSVLKLTGNKIEDLHGKDFKNLAATLKELYVGSNKITTINSRSLPEDMWERLETIDLTDNRWNCDCGIIWFQRWMKQNQDKLVGANNTKQYVCNSDEKIKGTPLLNFSLSIESCFSTSLDYYLVSTFLIVLVTYFSVFAAAILHRFRWHAKYWYFVYKVFNHILSFFVWFLLS